MNPQPTPPSPARYSPPKKANDRLLQDIIDYLRLHHHLHSAFLLSKQTHTTATRHHYPPATTHQKRQFTYTLVIIQNKVAGSMAGPAQQLDALYNLTQKQARVYVIPFTKPAVIKKMDFGCNFLTHVLIHTPCVYKQDDTWQQFKNYRPLHHKTVGEAIQKHWDTRYKRATYLLDTGSMIDADHEPTACFEMFHLALTQLCLGLIYVHWEYKPGYTALPYLLHLCSLITPLPHEVFPKDHYPSQFLFHHLCTARTNLTHKTKPRLTLGDVERAWRKCDGFLNKAGELVEERMGRSLHFD